MIFVSLLIAPVILFADYVPYSVQSVHGLKGKGFLELRAPGKLQLKKKVYDYTETIYISINRIASVSKVPGVDDACIITYTSGTYTENISVQKQSCSEVISQVSNAK